MSKKNQMGGENEYPDPVECVVCHKQTYFTYACENAGDDHIRWFCSRGCLEKHRKEQGKIFPHPKE